MVKFVAKLDVTCMKTNLCIIIIIIITDQETDKTVKKHRPKGML